MIHPVIEHWTKLARLAVASALLATAWGCVSLKPVVLDRKTQLENQVLGAFQRLEHDLVLASSVRGSPPAAQLSPLQREAVEAMMIREFYRDDINALKQAQLVGEGNEGLLVELGPPETPERAAEVRRLVKLENESRMVIMQRVIQRDRNLSDKDLPLVRRVFHRLSHQTAQPGERVQGEDGQWVTIEAPREAEPDAAASKGQGR